MSQAFFSTVKPLPRFIPFIPPYFFSLSLCRRVCMTIRSEMLNSQFPIRIENSAAMWYNAKRCHSLRNTAFRYVAQNQAKFFIAVLNDT